jgi:putative N6-adenine-specific DNA methylase
MARGASGVSGVSGGSLELFAVCAPGLEEVLSDELLALGVRGSAEPGGVGWTGGPESLYRANLHLRTASRVTVLAASFRARSFIELERHADRIPWERWVAPGDVVRLRVTSRRSKLYHEGAIAQRIRAAIERRVGPLAPHAAEGDDDEAAMGQLFVVRFHRDACLVRADASGALLHLRGYRQAVARAPLRETLAAAMLLASGWRHDAPLVDPLCGSGTIPIEAALLAMGVPPGLASAGRTPRAYAFTAWPDFDPALWERVVGDALSGVRTAHPAPIAGSDRDAGAIDAARANAVRAGVEGSIDWRVRPLSALEAPGPGGWLVANPPYGVRVGERGPLRDLYASIGHAFRQRLDGGSLALLTADRMLEGHVGVPLRERFATSNGGIPVRLMVSDPGDSGSGVSDGPGAYR